MTKNPQVVKDDVLEKWLKPMCVRLMGRRCTTLYCLKRGGYAGEPADVSIATCEPYEAYNALSGQNDAATRMRDKCVERVRAIAEKFERESFAEAGNQRLIEKTRIDTARVIAKELESLTLDQGEQKQ